MSSDDLPRTPEGGLIRSARNRAIPKISIPSAAARVGISAEHWGNIERGYKSVAANEPRVPVEASPELMAKMAAVVRVTPEQMETEGRRSDAAAIMREMPRSEVAYARAAKPSHGDTPPLIAALLARPGMDKYLAEIDAERADGGFVARDKYEVAIWTDPLLHEEDKRVVVAYSRLTLAEGVQMGGQTDSTVGLSQGAGL